MPIIRYENTQDRWGYAVYRQGLGPDYHYIVDNATGEVYNNDPDLLIRFKCLLLTAFTPIAAIARVIYHLARTIFFCFAIPIAITRGKISYDEGLKLLGESAFDILRPLWYGLCNMGAALTGIFLPLEGRKYYALFERTLNRQENEIHTSQKFYLAICAQPLYRTAAARGRTTEEMIGQHLTHMQGTTNAGSMLANRFACNCNDCDFF